MLRSLSRVVAALLVGVAAFQATLAVAAPLSLHLRSRQNTDPDQNQFQLVEKQVEWDPKKTAIVICDMWDQHWCQGATRRVAEMAPRMNETVAKAREQGVLVIHCPSSCMEAYKDTPQRKLAELAPKVETKIPLMRWCKLNPEHEPPLPIDDSDGGCDCQPHCKSGNPWRRQIDTIEVRDGDAITDSAEAFYLMHQRGIENVIVMGVHTNMCVLGRPFSIRQMVGQGMNVALMRDMTDSMYNSRKPPMVNHFRGTELVIEHIEKHWCPTLTSSDFTGKPEFRSKEDERPHIVCVLNDNHYNSLQTVPKIADELEDRYGYHVAIATAEKGKGIPGIRDLKHADLAILFVRREGITPDQLAEFQAFLDAGKPLIAIRTASHAFSVKNKLPEGLTQWEKLDADVLGGNYTGHYTGNEGAELAIVPEQAKHPILTGILPEGWHSTGELYKVSPLASDATVLVRGSMAGQPAEPIAWIRNYKKAKIFYTSLGHPEDFKDVRFQRLLINAVQWALGKPAPEYANTRILPKHYYDTGKPLPPVDGAAALEVPQDLKVEQVLAEPTIAQPLFLNFDERGRMWLVEYRQYPFPAGLKILSEDKFLRATYDKVPPPPPNHFKGADRISIHEDTDGDGTFDKHSTFVDGLNIVSAVERGRGGVWVLNPPYLLFYPDKNNDDVPDGDPEVHLQGFGLEDTHSVVNSLQWGPDGWLYAAQGSTVSGDVIRPGLDKKPMIHSMGQLIWRYHPEQRRYEIFAEGGGNAFGVEIDSKGRIFSGHNGGDTRGFHYVQGAYLQKGFTKHGPLSNPFSFGYFAAMKHDKVPRFTHCTIIYDGGALPTAYDGKLFGVHPILSHVVYSDLLRDGSSFQTKDIGMAIKTPDAWFRPVDIKVGPDGAIYVADMYEGQIAHLRHHDGAIDKTNGRVYRLSAKSAQPIKPFDLSKRSSAELVELLKDKNKWFRRAALRLLGDRKDASVAPELVKLLDKESGQTAVEALWALNLSAGLSEDVALKALHHSDPFVRVWTVRLLGDSGKVSPALAARMAEIATSEPNVEVRSQLACTAKRLPGAQGLPIVERLIAHNDDAKDIHLPLLLWWAIESKADSDRDAVVAMFEKSPIWSEPLVKEQILHRLMRRYAAAGSRKDLLTCAKLLALSPTQETSKALMRGFEEAFQGRPLSNLPEELVEAMSKVGGGSIVLNLRQGQPEALAEALKVIADSKGDVNQRLQFIQIFGEVKQPKCVPALLEIVRNTSDDGLRMAAMTSLQIYDVPETGTVVLALYDSFNDDVRSVAQTLLVSRRTWALEFLAAVDTGRIEKRTVPLDVVRKLTVHRDDRIAALVKKHWGAVEGATTAEMQQDIARLQGVIRSGSGDPYAGKKLFTGTCAKCHRLFTQGGQIGPDLTTFKRDDVGNMLVNIVNPSAEVREGFETYQVLTDDGRVVVGFLVDRDTKVVVLRGVDGQNISFTQDQIEEMTPVRKSLMPEGVLRGFTDRQVRDLFAYLRSTQPLAD
jgi:putative heme-binding domain-containing protein